MGRFRLPMPKPHGYGLRWHWQLSKGSHMSHEQKKTTLLQPFNDPTKNLHGILGDRHSDFRLVDWVNNSLNGSTTYNHELQKLKLTLMELSQA